MELQNQLNEESSIYFCNAVGRNDGKSILINKCSPLQMDGNSNPYCNYSPHSYSGSYATDARIRLETLKSGSSSPSPNSSINGTMYSYDYSRDIWEIGLNERSALDTVDLIDVERLEENEESWLYVSPKSVASVEKIEPAFSWCRHVLDNRSPEMETACRQLISTLSLKLSREHRHLGLQQNCSFSFDSPVDHQLNPKASFSSKMSPNSLGSSVQGTSPESSHRLQNITDVYDMARLQEANLRREYINTPRGHESLPPSSNIMASNSYNVIHGKRTVASSCQSFVPVTSTTEKNCLSPKVTKLHQYKVLKRAQNQGSTNRSSSPLRTSLRSLQAVRSSRSLDIDDLSLDHILQPRPGASSARGNSSCRSSSNTARHVHSDVPLQSMAIKRCQRSHSLSPCRIPQPPTSSPQHSRGPAMPRTGRQLQR